MRIAVSLSSLVSLGAVAALSISAVGRAQPVEGGPDPSTAYGQSVIQNQQYQQQEQQNEQYQQQLQEEGRQRDQEFRDSQRQYYGAQGGDEGDSMPSGPFAAMYFDGANLHISRGSWNFPSAVTARAAAIGACYRAAGTPCKMALQFNNACGAFAYGEGGVWAARSANSLESARSQAVRACESAGGKACAVHLSYCSPNDN